MIRPARECDAGILTRISFASKGHWPYPGTYFEIWKDELTVTPDDIMKNKVFVYEQGAEILGYYAIVHLGEDIIVSGIRLPGGFWLEHMFVDPPHIGRGIGSKLFCHLLGWCEREGVVEMGILSDPNARGFYEKMGCRYVGEFPSTIRGRTTPHLRFLQQIRPEISCRDR